MARVGAVVGSVAGVGTVFGETPVARDDAHERESWPLIDIGALATDVPAVENVVQGGYLIAFYRYAVRGLLLPFLVVLIP